MEEKSTIIHLLNESVEKFNALIEDLKEEEFENNINNKWSAGQDLVHLVKLLKIVNIAYLIPKPILQLLYGKNKNESKSLEALRTLYKNALAGGAKSPSLYIPKPVQFKNKNYLMSQHVKLNHSFTQKINNLSDLALDSYRLPHPILGKISLRELAIFTSFHTVHHIDLLKSKLGK
jgi:hypothetical protein